MSQIPLYFQQAQHQASASQQGPLPSINHSMLQQPPPHHHLHTASDPHPGLLYHPVHPQQQHGVKLQPILNDGANNNIALPSLSQSTSRHGSQTINPNHLPPKTQYQPLKPPHQGVPVKAPLPNPPSGPSTSLRRGPWSPEEDRKLLDAINVFGASNWVRISQSLGSRTPKQCRERYHQNLKPSLNRNPISHEEGALIEELVQRYGKRWAEIARHLNGRSDNAIKNWWNGGANRRRRASSQAILEAKTMHSDEIQPLRPSDSTPTHSHHPSIDASSNGSGHSFNEPITPHQQTLPPHEQYQRQLGVKRFLEEQHFPPRRHSAQLIMTSDSASPVASFNFNGGCSRNSLVSLDCSDNNSRRSSLAFDYANQPSSAYRKNSITSTHSTGSYLQSPVFGGQRNSIPGTLPNLPPLSPMPPTSGASQIPTGPASIASQLNLGNNDNNLFRKDFTFNKPVSNSQVKLPGPSSIQTNQNFLQSPRVQSGLRENVESQPPRPLNIIELREQTTNTIKREQENEKPVPCSEKNERDEVSKEDVSNANSKNEDKQKVMNISNLLV